MRLILTQTEDQLRVEQALPGYMMALLFESMKVNAGLEMRPDMVELANKSSVLALQGVERTQQLVLAKIIEKDGETILTAANADLLATAAAGLARMLVRTADRGVMVENNALLIALAIATDVEESNGEDGISWGSEAAINKAMNAIDNEARRLGYFSGISVVH